jgi:hypothetical protein
MTEKKKGNLIFALHTKNQVYNDISVCKDPKEQVLYFDFARQALYVFYQARMII